MPHEEIRIERKSIRKIDTEPVRDLLRVQEVAQKPVLTTTMVCGDQLVTRTTARHHGSGGDWPESRFLDILTQVGRGSASLATLGRLAPTFKHAHCAVGGLDRPTHCLAVENYGANSPAEWSRRSRPSSGAMARNTSPILASEGWLSPPAQKRTGNGREAGSDRSEASPPVAETNAFNRLRECRPRICATSRSHNPERIAIQKRTLMLVP